MPINTVSDAIIANLVDEVRAYANENAALRPLLDLLAVVNRDGGHRAQEIGIPAAVKEALWAHHALKVRVAELEAALRGLLDGLDDYWVPLPEGVAALEAARAALAAEKGETT